jgi:hypothetical protein
MTFTTHFTSVSEMLAKAIIETEDLDLECKEVDNALGDTILEFSGSKEEVRIFKEIYTMVGGN